MKKICLLIFSLPLLMFAQQGKDLGGKDIMVVKPYKPVLGESLKISDVPEGDTTSTNPPVLDYTVRSKKAQTEYEASVIKAVKIKEEQLQKLYRSYARLGIGNYTTYLGDLYVNALRSKQGALGLSLNHFSGNPGFDDAGPAGFSNNHGGVYGKYFLDKSTFDGEFNYNRDIVHYYGYDGDTVIEKDDIKQRFNTIGIKLGLASNNLTQDKIDYAVKAGYSSLNDLYDVTETDFLLAGKIGKKIAGYYFNADLGINLFKKSLAKNELVSLTNDLSRSTVNFGPSMNIKKEKMDLTLGLNLNVDKAEKSIVKIFPNINITLPIAEKILYVFAGLNGNVIKNTYQTITTENPFVSPMIDPFNSYNKLELKGGVNGNFSQRVSFIAMVKYSDIQDMLLYIEDSVHFNQFNVMYEDGKVLDIHAELGYKAGEKFKASLKFDQYSYTMEHAQKAWHRPGSEIGLTASYNVWDKILLNAGIYGYGSYYVRKALPNGAFDAIKVSGYADINLGIEYRYSKILSIFVNLNNLGFSKYYRWYNYPSEKFNALGGLKVSF
jgi:hypothetical protein